MTKIRSFVIAASFFFCLASALPAADAESAPFPDEGTIPADAVRADFKRLYETLAAAHADLYVYRSRDAYDHYYQETLEAIDAPMTALEAVKLFTPFVAFGQIGHAKIGFPVQDYIAYVVAGGTLLPLDIRVENGRILIAHNYSGAPVLAPGMELVAIDGQPAADWLERIGRLVSAERPYMTHAQLESMFPRLVWLDGGEIDAFELGVRGADGRETTITVDAVPAMTIEEQKGAREGEQHSRSAQLLADGIAYLRPGPFYAADEGESQETFEKFIDEAFLKFIAAGATDLVIDLRNNPGGDNSFSDPMIAWFADEPFSFASKFVVKASQQTREVLRGLAEKYPGGISAQMLETMQQYKDGETFGFEIPLAEPRDPRFSGRVWALVNRHSYSNATTVAAIIQDYGFGTILGEETADLPSSYASSAQFTLPATGLTVTYPKAYFLRPSGDEALRGVVPEHALQFPIAASGQDAALQGALEHILSQRP